MMGLKLSFSLHQPKKAQELAEVNFMQDDQENNPPKQITSESHTKPQPKRMKAIEGPSMSMQQPSVNPKSNNAEPALHALDP